MRRKVINALVCGIFLSLGGMVHAAYIQQRPLNFFEPSETVVTPHIKWLKPYSKGPLKVLFITHRQATREIVEFSQRIDMQYETFCYTKRNWKLETDFFQQEATFGEVTFENETREDAENRLAGKLTKDYDLIIVGGNVNWSDMPAKFRYEILKKVKEGTGLILQIKNPDEYLEKIMENRIQVNEDAVLSCIPFKNISIFADYTSQSDLLKNRAEFAQLGEGRVIRLGQGWSGGNIGAYSSTLIPMYKVSPAEVKLLEYDYLIAFYGRLMLWAGKKEPGVKISGSDVAKERGGVLNVRYEVAGDAEINRNVEMRFVLRDMDGTILSEQKLQTLLPHNGKKEAVFTVKEPLQAGNYMADLWVNEEGKTLNFGSVRVKITSASRITKIELPRDNYRKEEAITGKAVVENNAGIKGLSLEVRQKDFWGRVSDRVLVSAEIGSDSTPSEINFMLDNKREPLTVLQKVEVRLLQGNEVMDSKESVISISNLYLYPDGDDLRAGLWDTPDCGFNGIYSLHRLYELLYSYGFDTSLSWAKRKKALTISMTENRRQIPAAFWIYPGEDRTYIEPAVPPEEGPNIRKPCLTSPDYRDRTKTALQTVAGVSSQFSDNVFNLGDENGFGSNSYCFSTTCIKYFQDFLKEEYKGIETLNKEYGTDYKDWGEIKPVLINAAKANPSLMPLYVDFRRAMQDVYAGFYAYCADSIREVFPDAKVGCEGSDGWPGCFETLDIYKYVSSQSFINPYRANFLAWAVNDFARPKTIMGQEWIGGYHPTTSLLNANHFYRVMFMGSNISLTFCNMGGAHNAYSIVSSDYSLFDFGQVLSDLIKDFKAGPAKLLINSDRQDDGIGIFYSAASVLIGETTPELGKAENVLNALTRILEDTGFGFRIVAYKEVADGKLPGKNLKVLFLPYCQGISEKEAAEIKKFAGNGGIVIADLRPGVRNEHGREYPSGGILDDLFGVKQYAAKPAAKKSQVTFDSAAFTTSFPEAVSDTSLQVTAGKSIAKAGDAPAFIVNNYGKGKAVLLNFSLDGYGGYSPAAKETYKETISEFAPDIRQFFVNLLHYAGTDREAEIIQSDPDSPPWVIRNYRRKNGQLEYLCLLHDLFPTPKAKDEYLTSGTVPPAKDILVRLPGKRHIYDIEKGKYIGYASGITDTMEFAGARMYSLLPYKVTGIKLSADRKVRQGEILNYNIGVNTDSKTAGNHVIRIDFLNPDGKEAEYYGKNALAENGKFSGTLPLAYNETPGEWTMKVKDTATGASDSTKFLVIGAE